MPFTSFIVREALANRIPTIYNTTDVKRDYIYVEDLMQYLYLMIITEKKYKAEIFNLCSNKGYSALEIAETVYKVLGKEFVYNKGDSGNFWDKYETLFNKNYYNLSKERVKQEVFKNCIGDNSKAVKEFSYVPKVDLLEGLKKIIEYQKSYNNYE